MNNGLARKRLLQMYLSNLQVNVTALGFNPVWSDWRDIDYTPDYNKFYFISDGEGWLKIGDQELYPKPGQLALMPEGIRQSYSAINDKPYTKYWCHFTAKIGTMNLFDLIRLPWMIDVPVNDDLPAYLFKEMLRLERTDSLSSSLNLNACLLRLVGYFLDRSVQIDIQLAHAETSDILRAALAYIDDHFQRNITIQELADLTHMHPNYFIRLSKKHFGTTPIQYVNRKRIDKVKWLLASTDLTLSAIGEQAGIPDSSYLSKLFKSTTGLSPTHYKMLAGQKRI
ncbi:AraC-type DNA-binding protein [Cohnella sp. OV330]|uniref:AraC family transcriptional regulator n=1 Tax=Cohnella sp. OV330 TaxID=1855288 RepID=UPI0008EBB988|nr:AraC family transcriptional regulator [Cohnella sp. OV330]SFB22823.1 AraC-type DNA-binding protein [Cohnella sp. OV330]